MPLIYFEIVGWIGMILILVAYWLVSIRKITPTSNIYQFLNLLGAAFVIVNVAFHSALPSVALNTIWFFIALFSLLKKKETTKVGKIILTVTDGGDFGFGNCSNCGKLINDHPSKCPNCGVIFDGTTLSSPTGGSDF